MENETGALLSDQELAAKTKHDSTGTKPAGVRRRAKNRESHGDALREKLKHRRRHACGMSEAPTLAHL
jgi:hypothetical protein